jgi:hypothetical protein
MATKHTDNDDFDFEIEDDTPEIEAKESEKPEIEVVDDTPEADRDRDPMPKEIVDELEADELEEYSDKVKARLKQLKKVWHDERREKERLQREQQETLSVTQRLLEEKRRLESTLQNGEQSLLDSYKQSAEYETEMARRAYREAYEAGDAEKLLEAQEKLTAATYKSEQLRQYKPTRQVVDEDVQPPVETQPQAPQPDAKTLAWQERNTWYGAEPEMTASALGLHQKLITERGPQFAGTDEYWTTVDKTMRRRFPEYFGESETNAESDTASARAHKPAQVVAPATRSRSPKKIVLSKSQVALAKRLGLTNEQYARELAKTEL